MLNLPDVDSDGMCLRPLSLAAGVVLLTCVTMMAPAPVSAATPTPSAAVTPTPLPDPIILEGSFVSRSGREIWICIASQFDGTIEKIVVKNVPSEGCDFHLPGLGLQSGADSPHRHLVRLEHPALTCDAGPKHWHIDYIPTVNACTPGCISEVAIKLAADDPFGFGCSSGGVFPIRAILDSYIAKTTGKLRFDVRVAQAFASVGITTLRIYDGADDFVTDCTTNVTITGGGTGLFDTQCTPDAAALLIAGTGYYAMISGKADGNDYIGYLEFTLEAAP